MARTLEVRDMVTHVLLTSRAREPKSPVVFDVAPEAEIFDSISFLARPGGGTEVLLEVNAPEP